VIDVGQPGFGESRRDRLIDPRGYDVRVVLGQAPRDRDDLSRRLAGAEDRLGSPAAQRTVVIDLGEPEILVREAPELVDRAVDVEAPGPEVFEESPDRFPIHRSLAGGA
jgi:hypothetical protein